MNYNFGFFFNAWIRLFNIIEIRQQPDLIIKLKHKFQYNSQTKSTSRKHTDFPLELSQWF